MSERKPYLSDLSDEQWSWIEPVLTAWKDRHQSVSGHQGAYTMREIVNAILYQGRTGCQWAYLPHDLPPKSATYYYFAAWRDDGTDQVIHELLRCQVRERARRLEDPTLVVLDTQSVHVAPGVPSSTTGRDPAKRVPGRKRALAVDVLGLVIAVIVLAANAHDNAAGIALLDQVAAHRRQRPQGPGRPGLQEAGRRARRHPPGHRRRDRRTQPAGQRVRSAAETLEGRADLRDPDTAPTPGPRLRAPPVLLRLPCLLGDDPGHGPAPHRREHAHLARTPSGDGVNLQPLLDALGIQEHAAQALADDLRTQIDELQGRLREAQTQLEHLAITRKTVTALADRIPARSSSPDVPEHPDYPRILALINEATVALRAREVCEALDHELLPKNIEGTRAKLKRLVKLGILTELDAGSFAKKP